MPLTAPAGSEPPSGVRRKREPPKDLDEFLKVIYTQRAGWVRKLRVGPDGEDLLQEALLLLFSHRDEVEPPMFRGWLRTALLHQKLHLRRQQARWRAHEPQLCVHQEGLGSSFPTPDTPIWQDNLHKAVEWLVEQVKPQRRQVAAHYVLDNMELDAIAAKLEIAVGTAASRWERAVGDMRAALQRERAKCEVAPWLVLVFVLFERAWLWLVGQLRNVTDQVSSVPDAPLAAASVVLGVGDARSSKRRGPPGRERSRALVAFAAWVFLVVVVGADVAIKRAPESQEEITAVASAFVFKPYLSTNAEREREWGEPKAKQYKAKSTRVKGSSPVSSPPKCFMGRRYLTRATAALMEGYLVMARDAVRLYELSCPDNPYPAQYASLAQRVRSQ